MRSGESERALEIRIILAALYERRRRDANTIAQLKAELRAEKEKPCTR